MDASAAASGYSSQRTLSPTPISSIEPRLRTTQRVRISNARRYFLFAIFCIANLLDAYNLNALFAGLPALKAAFGLDEVDASWVMSAFELTYASFLLISGRISDVYHPKPAFVAGVFALGILSLGAGFVQNKIGLIVIRAFCGVCAALSIPSSLALIVRFFPEPREQSIAIALFGGVGALGNVFGTMISAVFVEFANYRWIFWFTTVIAVPAAVSCLFLIPSRDDNSSTGDAPLIGSRLAGLKKLDLVGVSILTVALILFIFAITSGSGSGWASAEVLAPLIISIFLIVGFFLWEKRMPTKDAAVPPQTWFLPNFSVLFGVSLLPYFWWTTVFVVFFPLWQQVYGWSAIESGLRMIPIGISATLLSFTSPLGSYISRKYLILAGQMLTIAATILLAFGDAPDRYWRFVFPGLIIGSAGSMITYMHVSIAIFQTAPATMAGVIGAMFNCAIQLGAALGLSIDTSIESSIEAKPGSGGFEAFAGRRAVLWWLLAAVCAETVAVVMFYHVRSSQGEVEGQEAQTGNDEVKGECQA
ncbi:MFS general substrate transporter [Lentinus tigrinus ALCF2SS1-7]|uniref:MFS general substrate transporter n=1 Tax=Lentinus tigrinus ALCF2SS1-6 TaxID=1328759 RepID=A0A5C2S9H8_9APHY|nr:MFS general substrate transporter [Lentinus tigrinus ALCF2SS1-6]RPD70467.1 MFS general substrate transporter [Lentinus tigrinus ALCF2SS1-7]